MKLDIHDMRYRPEIDGLRALAVVPVILFHAGFELFGGGYAGVDVFFVISGYLITSIILNENHKSLFSLVNFYERRMRRILPALFVVLLTCLPLAYLIMLPHQMIDFSKAVGATAVFGSNILFWQHAGYFAAEAELNPLLHTWSLAVEEQFYILFPLLFLGLWRFGFRAAWIGISLVCLASLGALLWAWPQDPDAVFYLLPTRAWELLAGALLAFYLFRSETPKGIVAEIGAILGLGLILYALLGFDSTLPFPDPWAIVPVLGSVLVLLCAQSGTVVARLLSLRVCVAIGLISYSLYLWHQPLFAFARLILGETELPDRIAFGLIALTGVLAWATWAFVETPFRRQTTASPSRVFASVAAVSAAFCVFAVLGVVSKGFLNRYPEHQKQWVADTYAERGHFVRHAYNTKAKGAPLDPARPNLLLIGDSFSQDLYNMIQATKAFGDHAISARYLDAKCQVYIGPKDIAEFIEPKHKERCAQPRNQVTPDLITTAQTADVVIFAFNWRRWSGTHLPQTLQNFAFSPDQKVFVLGRKSFAYHTKPYADLSASQASQIRTEPSTSAAGKVNAEIAALLPAEQFIDLQALVCDSPTECPIFTPEGALISHDGTHLTRAGAAYVGKILFNTPQMHPFKSPTP